MSDKQSNKKKLTKRLMPLYISAFFQSFVLWYAIEKLFLTTIGFNNATIGFMVALCSIVMLVVDAPSGFLADRWSRKGVLILASLGLALSSLVGGLSHGVGLYLIAAVLWAAAFACFFGMYSSIIYDTLAEELQETKLFEYFLGRLQLVDSIGLILSGLIGAFIASNTSLRSVYFISIPFVLISIFALTKFHEPQLHKQQGVVPFRKQINDTFKAFTNSTAIFPIVIVLVMRAAISYCLFEFSQLWLIALHTPIAYYGIAYAVLLAALGLGGVLVGHLKLDNYLRMSVLLALMLFGGLGLILFRTTLSVVVSQFVFALSLTCIYVIFSRLLHDNLRSQVRAGASSVISTLGSLAIIPVALLIGLVSQKFTIYNAAIVLLVLAVILSIFVRRVAKQYDHTGLVA